MSHIREFVTSDADAEAIAGQADGGQAEVITLTDLDIELLRAGKRLVAGVKDDQFVIEIKALER